MDFLKELEFQNNKLLDFFDDEVKKAVENATAPIAADLKREHYEAGARVLMRIEEIRRVVRSIKWASCRGI